MSKTGTAFPERGNRWMPVEVLALRPQVQPASPTRWGFVLLGDSACPARGEVGQRSSRVAPPADPWTWHNATRYTRMVIRSFGNPMTERVWSRERTKKLDPRIERTAL